MTKPIFLYKVNPTAIQRLPTSCDLFPVWQMKKFGLEPEDPTYTALFNACSNSPWKVDGLTRAKHLHDLMLEKGYEPNTTTSHAMIKAYGVCGDIQQAFVVMDEMLAAGLKPNAETFSFLLMACISDREAGLKHAIEVNMTKAVMIRYVS